MHYFDGVEEQIGEHLAGGGTVTLCANHTHNFDSLTLASIAFQPVFEPLRGNTIIPAKASLFETPVVGRFIAQLLAHPTFRKADFTNDPAGEALRWAATGELLEFNSDFINKGGHNAMFFEGGRKDDPRKVQKLKPGIAIICQQLVQPENHLIVPLGIAYRNNKKGNFNKKSVMTVGQPVSVAGLAQDQLLRQTRDHMQAALDMTHQVIHT